MKKFILSFLPLSCFAALPSFDYSLDWNSKVTLYNYTYNVANANQTSSQAFINLLPSSVSSVLSSRFTAVLYNNGGINYPQFKLDMRTGNATIGMCVLQSVSGTNVYYSLGWVASNLAPYYNFAASLARSGFESSGIQRTNKDDYYNINLSLLFSDLVNSTNTYYRSLVIGYLQTVSSGVQSIDSTVGSINSDYQFVNSLYLNPSNFTYRVAPYLGNGSSGIADIEDLISSNPHAASEIVSAAAAAYRNRITDILSAYSQFANAPSDYDSPFYNKSLSDFLDPQNSELGNQLLAQYHNSTPINQMAQLLSTNDWVSGVKKSLSNNTEQIKEKLNYMFDGQTNQINNALFDSSGQSFLSPIADNTSSIAGDLRNAIREGSNGSAAVNVHLDGDLVEVNVGFDLEDVLANLYQDVHTFAGNSEGINNIKNDVRSWYTDWRKLFEESNPGWNAFQYLDGDLHSDIVSLGVSLSNCLHSLTLDITNCISSISNNNSYLLLSDYADYINSGGLSSLLDVMDDDEFSDLKARVYSLYSTDIGSGYGRWWRYFTGLSTVQANSIMQLNDLFQTNKLIVSNLKSDFNDVQDISDSSTFRKILDSIPSETDIFDKVSQITNSIDSSGFTRLASLIPDLSNTFSTASYYYDHDFQLPSSITFTLVPSSDFNRHARIVEINPYKHYDVFRILHYGIAFAYSIVNIILLPKFLLFLVRLFDSVFKRYERFLHTSIVS